MMTFPKAPQYETSHSVQTMRRALWLARLCKQALIAEAELTPKPGLVDQRGQGAHRDLSLPLMQKSAQVIEPYLAAMALASASTSVDQPLREHLAFIGRQAESAMYLATAGCNTHKGAIWVMGLLVVAASVALPQTNAADLGSICAHLSSFEDRAAPLLVSHGHIVAHRYGFPGARGEARLGFPHVIEIGLPALRGFRRAGDSETIVRLNTLLSIMARLDDTCVLYRGHTDALHFVKKASRGILDAGGCSSPAGRGQLRELDQRLLAWGVSPGGSADLLAATLFLDAYENGQDDLQQDRSVWEFSHGTD